MVFQSYPESTISAEASAGYRRLEELRGFAASIRHAGCHVDGQLAAARFTIE
jgi:hypothetical protein